jgi:hypothetical protein
MSTTLVVTTFENINQQTGKMLDPELKGYITNQETVQEPIFQEMQDENGNPAAPQHIGVKLRSICTVAWVEKAPFHPAVAPYYADQLVLLGLENSIADVIELVNELTDRVATMEAFLDDEEDDDGAEGENEGEDDLREVNV